MQTNTPISKEPIEVEGDRVRINYFETKNRALAETLKQSENRCEALDSMLTVGVVAFTNAQNDARGRDLNESISELQVSVDKAFESHTATLVKGADKILADATEGMSASLNHMFDKKNQDGIPQQFDETFNKALERFSDATKKLTEESKRQSTQELEKRIREEGNETRKEFREELHKVRSDLATEKAVAKVASNTPIKGLAYEKTVGIALKRHGSNLRFLTEPTGTIPGILGNKKGDHVITMPSSPNSSTDARGVIECKAQAMSTMAVLRELDAGIENRDAVAGFTAFKNPEDAPIDVPLHIHGNKALVVWDPDERDDAALKVALMWLQMQIVTASDRHPSSGIDLNRIELLLDEARSTLTRFSTMRRHHTSSKLAIDKAGEEASKMQNDFLSIVDDLCTEIASELK